MNVLHTHIYWFGIICPSPSLSEGFDLGSGKSNIVSSPFTFCKWTMLCSILYVQNNPPLRDSVCSCWYFTTCVILQDWGLSLPRNFLFLFWIFIFPSAWGVIFPLFYLKSFFFTMLLSLPLPFSWSPFFSRTMKFAPFIFLFFRVWKEKMLLSSMLFTFF